MKLFEIVNTQQTNVNIRDDEDAQTGRPSNYATVQPDPEDSHMVLKQTKSNDPYLKYLEWLNANEDRMASNPYFPRVYKQSSPNADGKVNLQMEKLQEFDTLNSKELNMVAKRMLGKDTDELISDYLEQYSWSDDYNSIERRIRKNPHRAVGDYMKRAAQNGEFSNFKDPLLKQAVKAIYDLHQQHGAHMDMHAGNFMVRRGPTGPQVVVIDPLS